MVYLEMGENGRNFKIFWIFYIIVFFLCLCYKKVFDIICYVVFICI